MLFRSKFRVVFLLLILLPGVSWGWSAQGHLWIAQSAAMQLNVKEQVYFDALLKEGVLVPPRFYHAKLEERLASLGVWADTIRGTTLAEVFKKYGTGAVPVALQPWATKTTDNWHYTNQNIVALEFTNNGNSKAPAKAETKGKAKECQPKQAGELIHVWPKLLTAYGQAENPKDKNIVLAFILHFSADAYQPLHLMSAVNKQCELDKGGNALCVEPKANATSKNKCEKNLHQLWDEGFDVFKQPLGWHKKLHPLSLFSLDDAVKRAKAVSADVYKPQLSDYSSKAYTAASKAIVAEQVDYAVGHSVFALKYLVTQK